MTTPRFPAAQTLLLDADDTLWENNIYFERAIAAFISYLNHRHYSPAEVREQLNRVERKTILAHGYGIPSFSKSLLTCFERLSESPLTIEQRERILSFARSITEAEIELLPGVAETLPELARRHCLILMTKGNHAEQAGKLSRSGLAHHFAAVEIVREKNSAAYAEVCHRRELSPHSSWMIGNSPRSDINPALSAGLHAIHIFHPHTWVLEHDEVIPAPTGQHLLRIESFAELAKLF
jgi:putative hydrolase of the HAD superfamily